MTAASPLSIIALISGGKDSFLALHHVLHQGHNIIALANLYPPASGAISSEDHDQDQDQDLNSYMYQTAGHNLLDLLRKCLPHFPLYRAPIEGSAENAGLNYEPSSNVTVGAAHERTSPGDETESLTTLLESIKVKHPEANAICSGAILSTYQRTRVESVARRLGLIPLTPLWQYPTLPFPRHVISPSAELDHIASLGLDARIVKVASAGLDESLLWRSLSDPEIRRKIERAVARFGGSALGEGGEYETIVVDGPKGLWKGRVGLRGEEWEVVRGGGGEAFVKIKEGGGRVLFHDHDEKQEGRCGGSLVVPEIWDPEFGRLASDFVLDMRTMSPAKHHNLFYRPSSSPFHNPVPIPAAAIKADGTTLQISNLSALSVPPSKQMSSILTLLSNHLNDAKLAPSSLLFVTILLRSMSSFPAMNAIYAAYFADIPLPPARVTVACGNTLPDGADIILSATADLKLAQGGGAKGAPAEEELVPGRKKGLHIQSRSYWAPANIGPYSQAIQHLNSGKVYVAGQIPLIPSSMTVYDPLSISLAPSHLSSSFEDRLQTFHAQACLSLQHLWRIGRNQGVRYWTGAVAYIARPPRHQTTKKHELSEAAAVPSPSPSGASEVLEEDDDDDLEMLKADIALKIWEKIHDPALWHASSSDTNDDIDENFDVWNQRHNNYLGGFATAAAPPLSSQQTQRAPPLPDFNLLPKGDNSRSNEPFIPTVTRDQKRLGDDGDYSTGSEKRTVPPLLAVQVAELPMGVEIEWQSVGLVDRAPSWTLSDVGHASADDNDNDDDDDDVQWMRDIARHFCFQGKVFAVDKGKHFWRTTMPTDRR